MAVHANDFLNSKGEIYCAKFNDTESYASKYKCNGSFKGKASDFTNLSKSIREDKSSASPPSK